MTNHVHLLLTLELGEVVSLFMQYIGCHYVPYINHKYSRSGFIWEGRYKAGLVQPMLESNPMLFWQIACGALLVGQVATLWLWLA